MFVKVPGGREQICSLQVPAEELDLNISLKKGVSRYRCPREMNEPTDESHDSEAAGDEADYLCFVSIKLGKFL